MSRSLKFKNNNYLDSSGIVDTGHGVGNYNRIKLSDFKGRFAGTPFYTTHYIELGYLNISNKQDAHWSYFTLLVNSTFYGVQHCSGNIISLYTAQIVRGYNIKIGGNYNRQFYYWNDTSTNRLYLYAYCDGGNGFGYWGTKILDIYNCGWVPTFVANVTKTDAWVSINGNNLI